MANAITFTISESGEVNVSFSSNMVITQELMEMCARACTAMGEWVKLQPIKGVTAAFGFSPGGLVPDPKPVRMLPGEVVLPLTKPER